MELSGKLYFSFRRFRVAAGATLLLRSGEPGRTWHSDWKLEHRFESYTLDVERRELRCGGELRHVEPQVFDLLHFLIVNRERVVSRDEIFQAVWHGRIVSDAVLSSRLNAVRAAIGDDGTQQRLIRTVYGKGFRFVGALFGATNSPPAASIVVPAYRFAEALKDAPVIAISPFATIGDDDSHGRAVAAALTETTAVSLHEIDWLRVAASYSGTTPTGSPSNSKAVFGKLRVRYLLLGSVQRDRDELRIVVRLVETASGIHLWAGRFHCPIVDSFRGPEQIAAKLACAVRDRIFAAESIRSRQNKPESLGAWGSIVAAVALMNTRKRPDLRMAQALLRKVISIDPKCAPCFSLLSIMATQSVHLGWKAQETARPVALRAAEKAIDLNSDDGWSHVALGYARLLIDNRPEDAIDIFATALKLNPNLAIAHYFIALASAYTGNCAASFRHADLAEQLAPHDLLALGNAGVQDNVRATASFVADRYRDGISFARKAIALSPRQTSAYRQLVLNHAFAGDREDAAAALAAVRTLAPDIPLWLRQQESRWSSRQDHQKYVDAFRLAGVK